MTDLDGRHRVQGLVNRKAVTVHTDATLLAVAEVLANDVIGVVLVLDPDGEIAGIVSERDIVRSVAAGDDPQDTRADEVMTTDLVMIDRGEEIGAAAALMHDADIRHLVVTDQGRPWGVVSAREVMGALVLGEV
jgi:signal-transduction protein with cAMP-binding, CBS, and nucleotidyltransferase domain